jgi:hypothetical protein
MKPVYSGLCRDEHDAYKNGDSSYGIQADSYIELLSTYGAEMADLNIIVKVRPTEVKGHIKEIFGRPVIPGWHEVKRVVGEISRG